MYQDDEDSVEWRKAYAKWEAGPDDHPDGTTALMAAFRAGMLYERSSRVRGPWTPAESYTVVKEYPTTNTKELARKLNRTEASVNARARSLGLRKTPEYLAQMIVLSGLQKPKG